MDSKNLNQLNDLANAQNRIKQLIKEKVFVAEVQDNFEKVNAILEETFKMISETEDVTKCDFCLQFQPNNKIVNYDSKNVCKSCYNGLMTE